MTAHFFIFHFSFFHFFIFFLKFRTRFLSPLASDDEAEEDDGTTPPHASREHVARDEGTRWTSADAVAHAGWDRACERECDREWECETRRVKGVGLGIGGFGFGAGERGGAEFAADAVGAR